MPKGVKPGTLPSDDGVMGSGLPLAEQGIAIVRRFAALLAIVGLLTTLNNVSTAEFHWIELSALCATTTGGVSYWMLRTGHYQLAIRVLIWGSALIVLGTSFIAAGIRTPALVFLPVLCMATAWLINVRSALMLGAISMGVMVFYVFAEQAGISLPTRPRNSLSYLLLYGFTFIAAGVVTWGSTRSFMRQIEALRDSEERFSALFRANPVPSSTIDRDGRTLDVNNAWVSLYGIAARDAMGKTAQEMGIWTNPDERKAVYLEMAHKGRVDGAPMTLRTAGGVLKPFLLYIAPVEFGGQQRLVTSVLDQSDRQAAEAAQRAINEALESRVAERTAELTRTVGTLQATQTELVEAAKLASLGAMVAGISHELNTPLGVAVTVASTVQDRIDVLRQAVTTDTLRRSTLGEFLDEQHEMAGLLLRSTERAAELVRSFKEVAVDRASERRRRFNLASLVQDILTSIQPGLGALHLALDLRVGTDIVCDSLPGPIGQVLTNLVQNAVVHAFAGRESGCISITADVQGSGASARVVLRIRDDGVGMSEYVRAHAFDPFFTTRLGQGGSGLGLSVSHRLANSMLGGSLAVESTPGAGTCFTFCFLQKLADAPAC